MARNRQSKFLNDDTSEEDVNAYREEYKNKSDPFYHCAHCDYRTYFSCDLKVHMEKEHNKDEGAPLAETKSFNEEEDLMMRDAIQVWKIYKLLQRMENK